MRTETNISGAPVSRRRALQALLATACAGLVPAPFAHAGRPIRFIVPASAASGLDPMARAAQHALARVLGQAVVIDNPALTDGMAGTAALVSAAPDGFTLGFVSNDHVITPSVCKSMPFDPINDITPLAMVGTTPMVLVCNPKLRAANANELIALLKASPGPMNFGSPGHGTLTHLATEMFLDAACAKANHVAHSGAGAMVTALISGEVAFATAALPSVQQHLKSGALRALGVASAERVAAAPEIPTMAEQGWPGFVVEGWFAFVAPKGMAASAVKHLNEAAQSAFGSAEVQGAMARQGNIIHVSTPQVAAEYLRSERVRYAMLVKQAGIEAR